MVSMKTELEFEQHKNVVGRRFLSDRTPRFMAGCCVPVECGSPGRRATTHEGEDLQGALDILARRSGLVQQAERVVSVRREL
jgi:hypothetical protein